MLGSGLHEDTLLLPFQDFGGDPSNGMHCRGVQLQAEPQQQQQQAPAGMSAEVTSGSPSSFGGYGMSSKTTAPGQRFKLPYQVTPCRESGPSQAERRLEALTLELEKELEMHMKKEYFGEYFKRRAICVCFDLWLGT